MSEPNKIFRSACSEDPLYCDASSSRRFKYKMKLFSKGTQSRSVLKILTFIVGFLLIACLFIVVGFYLYPHLVVDCKRPIHLIKYGQDQVNDYDVPFIGSLLRHIGICEIPYQKTSDTMLQLNENKSDNSFEKLNSTLQANDKCNCSNSNRSENNTSDLTDKCVCNKTHETDDSHAGNIGNKSENYETYLKNANSSIHSENIYFNETEVANGAHSVQINVCDCSKVREVKGGSWNVTLSDMLDVSECNCPEITEGNLSVNHAVTESVQIDDKPLEIRECQCPTIDTTGDRSINDANFGNKNVKDNGCICPEAQEMDDFSVRKTKNKSKKQGISSMSLGKVFRKVNSQFNKTKTGNKRKPSENKCICQKGRSKIDVIGNGTTNNGDAEFAVDEDCVCPDILEIDNFDINRTLSKKKLKDFPNLNTDECECPILPEMFDNATANETKTFSGKKVDGICVCSETHHTDSIYVSESEFINDSEMNHYAVTENSNVNERNYGDPTALNEGKKTDVEKAVNEEEKTNVEEAVTEKELNVVKENKTVYETILPESEKTGDFNKRGITSDSETFAVDEKERNNRYGIATTYGEEQSFDNETEIANKKELSNGKEADSVYGNTEAYDNKTEIVNKNEPNQN